MSDEFHGKAALVTGASRGIGAATAIALARAGCGRVLVHYNSNAEGAERTAAEIRRLGAEPVSLAGDLSSEAGIRAFVEVLGDYPDAIDYLVNNAGSLVRRAKLDELTYTLFNEVMDLNVKSLLFLTQAVASRMAPRGGAIVNLSSIAARTGGGSGAAVYAAAKAAVSALTKGLAKELAPRGIRVNAISPGTVDNDFHTRFSTREMLANVAASTP
ncbi:MAG: SDR family NAD(P)-dependent oxidoreductase, partial [Bryobacteraceae bacterium]